MSLSVSVLSCKARKCVVLTPLCRKTDCFLVHMEEGGPASHVLAFHASPLGRDGVSQQIGFPGRRPDSPSGPGLGQGGPLASAPASSSGPSGDPPGHTTQPECLLPPPWTAGARVPGGAALSSLPAILPLPHVRDLLRAGLASARFGLL